MIPIQIKSQITYLPESNTRLQQVSADMYDLVKHRQGRRYSFHLFSIYIHPEWIVAGKLLINYPLQPLLQAVVLKERHIIM